MMAITPSEAPRFILAQSPNSLVQEGVDALITQAFGPGVEIVFCRDPASLVSVARQPDMLLLIGGAETCAPTLPVLDRVASQTTKTVVFCLRATPRIIQTYLEYGISGVVDLGESGEYLAEALRFIWKGGNFVSSAFWSHQEEMTGTLGAQPATDAVSAVPARVASQPDGRLTPRQRAVVDLVRRGASNKEIARHLSISESTVKTHLHLIMRMVGAPSRKNLTALQLWDSI